MESTASGERWLTLLWSILLILSCLPMTLSTIYKEILLSSDKKGIDIIYLNGWVSIFQTLYSALLAGPAGMAMTPPVYPHDILQNLKDGWQCYYSGINSIVSGCHPDSCAGGAIYINVGLVLNFIFVLSTMFVIRWGSTSLLFLALTIMVPLGNLAFYALGTAFRSSDLIGLMVILVGLTLYRFSNSEKKYENQDNSNQSLNLSFEEMEATIANSEDDASSLRQPLLQRRTGDI